MEWGTLSATQPLVSATTEDRPPLEVRFVNESSAHLTVSWVDAAGRLRHGRRCAPGAGPLRVRDGSVRPEHVEGTFAGDAFVVYAGPGDDLAANADVVAADAAGAIAVAGWYAASDREPARGRVVRVADGPRRGPLDWLRGTPRGLAATAGAAAAAEVAAPKPRRTYAYARVDAGGVAVDVDARLAPDSADVAELLGDVAAAAAWLPPRARAVLAAAGTRVVVHEDTEGFGHTQRPVAETIFERSLVGKQ